MPVSDKFKKRGAKLFATAGDVGGLFMALIYIVYVGLLMLFSGVQTWLNYTMLGITVAYSIFLLVKIIFLNGAKRKTRLKKTTKLIFRYAKLAMRTTNAVLIILSIVNHYKLNQIYENRQLDESNFMPMLGIIVLVITLIISLAMDIIKYFLRKKLREIMSQWQSMGSCQKKEKLDFFIDKIMQSLENVTGLERYVETGKSVGRRVGDRFRNRLGAGADGGDGDDTDGEYEEDIDEPDGEQLTLDEIDCDKETYIPEEEQLEFSEEETDA